MVPLTGLEPVRYCYRGILSPLCLPIPPHPQKPRRNFSTRATAENQDLYAPCTDVLKLYFNGTLVGEGGFEPPKLLAADLQSVPFGHSGNPPYMKFGAGGRIRTPDLLITNQLLYQLSYTSV